METMHLTDKEKEMLEYYMSGWSRLETARMLCVTKSCMDYGNSVSITNTVPILGNTDMPLNLIIH